MRRNDSLNPDEQEHLARAREYLTRQVAAAGGFLSFERFMDLSLYAPGLGYYSGGAHKLGAAGDFITAPELSSLFGRCVARQCAQVLEAIRMSSRPDQAAPICILPLQTSNRCEGIVLTIVSVCRRKSLSVDSPSNSARSRWSSMCDTMSTS